MVGELLHLGHQVEIVTALPNYPRSNIFPGYQGTFYRREERDGLVVHRVWLFAAMGRGLRRILNYASFAITCLFGLLRAQKPDYIFVESPPLLLAVPAYLFSRIWDVPFIFNVADLWPDSMREMHLVKSRFFLGLLESLESWTYRKAAYVSAVTEGIRQSLFIEKQVPEEKLLFLPNGVDTALYRPRPADAALKQALGLEGKRIILYAGTQGHAHGLEHVIRAAGLLGASPEHHFLFVGDGSERVHLEQLQERLGIRNVTFHNPVPMEQLPAYFSIADCGLASLRDLPFFECARPAKVFPVLASGKPLIFVGKGEGARLVQRANAGVVVPPGDPVALAKAVSAMLGDPQKAGEYGRNGRRFVETNLQWSRLVGDWLAQFESEPAAPPSGAPIH
jgi:glycosyltransferase involved in cell wall biosynthesis